MKISCAFLICFLFVVAVVSSSAVPLKLEEKFDVTDHAQKLEDFVTGPDLKFKRLVLKMTDEAIQDAINAAFSQKDFPDANKKILEES